MSEGLMENDVAVSISEFYDDELEKHKCCHCQKIFYVVKATKKTFGGNSFLDNFSSIMLCSKCRKTDKSMRNKFSIPYADGGE